MKTRHLCLFVAALSGVPTGVMSQAVFQPGTAATVTVALTLSSTIEGLVVKDENGKPLPVADGGGPAFENTWSIMKFNAADEQTSQEDVYEKASKVRAFKYGNVEILNAMLENGELLEATSIAGWSILQLDEGGAPIIVAYHKTFGSVPVMITLEGTGIEEALARTEAYKSVTKMNGMNLENPPLPSFTETHTYSWKTDAGCSVSDFIMNGLFTGSGKLVKVLTGERDGDNKPVLDEFGKPMTVPLQVLGALKLAGIVGRGMDPLTGSEAVIEGSVSIAPAKVVTDMTVYNPM